MMAAAIEADEVSLAPIAQAVLSPDGIVTDPAGAELAIPTALPGLWLERGDDVPLVRLDVPAITGGMVIVAKLGADWKRRPELRWATWPEDLRRIAAADLATTATRGAA